MFKLLPVQEVKKMTEKLVANESKRNVARKHLNPEDYAKFCDELKV